MKAVELIEKLIKAGVSLTESFKEAKSRDGVDWDTFLNSDAYDAARQLVVGLLGQLSRSDVDDALHRVRSKQTELLRGRRAFELSIDELTQYDSLLTTENLLQDKLLATIGDRKAFWSWLVSEGAPALLKLAPVILPLLL